MMTNRNIFLRDLRKELSQLSLSEQEQIIDDYLITFEEKNNQGIDDDQIIKELGSPYDIARNFLIELGYANNDYDNARVTYDSEKGGIGLGIAMIIFDALIGIWLYISIYLSAISFLILGILIIFIPYSTLSFINFSINFTYIVVCVLLLGIGLVIIGLMLKVFRQLNKLAIIHINWLKKTV